MRLDKANELFFENMKIMDYSPATIKNYSRHLGWFQRYLYGEHNSPVDITEITKDDVDRYLFNELNETRYSGAYRHHSVTAIKSLFNFCYRKGYVQINTGKLIKDVKGKSAEREILSELEFNRMIKYITSKTVRAAVFTMYFAGLRSAEVTKLKLVNVDMTDRMLHVKEGKNKKDRDIPINDRLYKVLSEYLENGRWSVRTDNFFSSISGGLSKSHVNNNIKRALKKAGINKEISSHNLRHSFCSNLIERGADVIEVQKLAGHSHIETLGIYLHSGLYELQEAVNTL